jgi:hypothetical protein
MPFSTMKAVMPLAPAFEVGLGVDHQRVGIAAVGDPHLGAVQHVTVALFLGFQLHRHHVGTGIRLGHGQRADVFAGDQLGQVFLALRFAAVAANLVDAQIRVGAVGQADRGRGAGDFLQRDDVRQIAHVGAAVFLAAAVMPSRPMSPNFFHRSAGNSLTRSISAARGAISASAKALTASRSMLMSSPRPKSRLGMFMGLSPDIRVIGPCDCIYVDVNVNWLVNIFYAASRRASS